MTFSSHVTSSLTVYGFTIQARGQPGVHAGFLGVHRKSWSFTGNPWGILGVRGESFHQYHLRVWGVHPVPPPPPPPMAKTFLNFIIFGTLAKSYFWHSPHPHLPSGLPLSPMGNSETASEYPSRLWIEVYRRRSRILCKGRRPSFVRIVKKMA